MQFSCSASTTLPLDAELLVTPWNCASIRTVGDGLVIALSLTLPKYQPLPRMLLTGMSFAGLMTGVVPVP